MTVRKVYFPKIKTLRVRAAMLAIDTKLDEPIGRIKQKLR